MALMELFLAYAGATEGRSCSSMLQDLHQSTGERITKLSTALFLILHLTTVIRMVHNKLQTWLYINWLIFFLLPHMQADIKEKLQRALFVQLDGLDSIKDKEKEK